MTHTMDVPILKMRRMQRWHYLTRFPCLDEEPMDLAKPLPFQLKNLCVPRLRKCTFDLSTVNWQRARLLGMGLDGCVFRVYFGDQGPFALKLFWIPGMDVPGMEDYSASQRECQIAALLQTLRASLDQAAAAAATVAAGGTPDGPVDPPYVLAEPIDHADCIANFFAFSEQMRRNPVKFGHLTEPRALVPVTTMPRFAQCYGWLRFAPKTLQPLIPRRIFPSGYRADRKLVRRFDWDCADEKYYAIVYEYIASEPGALPKPPPPQSPPVSPAIRRRLNDTDRTGGRRQRRPTKAERDAAAAEDAAHEKEVEKYNEAYKRWEAYVPEADRARATAVLDFLFGAGFEMTNTPLARNWKSGVLVDHSEIVGPYMAGWHTNRPNPYSCLYKRLGLREDASSEKENSEQGLAKAKDAT